jgi:hypothetical protein
MNLSRLKRLLKNGAFRLAAVMLIVLIAGPEVGIALDLTIVLDVVGAELFLLSFLVGLRMVPWWFVFDRVAAFLYRIDPYFFVPGMRQVRQCPPLAVHVVPGFVAACMVVVLWGAVQLES